MSYTTIWIARVHFALSEALYIYQLSEVVFVVVDGACDGVLWGGSCFGG